MIRRNIECAGSVILGLALIVSAARAGLARGQATALEVKASGPKTFYADNRAGNNQVSIFSQATLEDFTVVCNQVTGQCRIDPKNLETLTGRFSLRVEDMRSGIDLRDTHLRGPEWFDAKRFPDVVVDITKVEEVKKADANTATLKLIGTCTMHGQTKPVSIPATLTYLDETPVTMKRVKGDLLRIRAEFDVKLSDYGITGPPGSDTIGLKVADKQVIKVTVFGSTEPPAPPLRVDTQPTTTAPAKPKPPAPPRP